MCACVCQPMYVCMIFCIIIFYVITTASDIKQRLILLSVNSQHSTQAGYGTCHESDREGKCRQNSKLIYYCIYNKCLLGETSTEHNN